MKKVSIMLLVILLILTGCKNVHDDGANDFSIPKNNISEEKEIVSDEQKDILSEKIDINANEIKEEVDYLHNINESIKIMDLDNGGILYYGRYDNIFIIKNKSIIDLSKDISSYPEISLSSNQMIYIDAVGFEMVGNLWLYDFDTEKNIQKTKVDYEHTRDTVKVAKWLDEDNILVIIGFADGTITQGGSLYRYDLNEEKLELLIESEKLMEIKDIEIDDDKVILTKVIWKDENYMAYEIQQEEKNISDIFYEKKKR